MLSYFLYSPPKELLLFAALVVTTFSTSGFIAIWAGVSRRHWFFGTVLAVATSAIPLLIPAHELVLLMLVQAVFTVLLLRLRRTQRQAAMSGTGEIEARTLGRAQWSLQTLLLLTVIAALILALLTRVPRESWAEWPTLVPWALGTTSLTLVAAWCGLGRARGWRRIVVACLLFPAALAALVLHLVRPIGSSGRQVIKKAAAAVLALGILLPPLLTLWWLITPTPIPPSTPSARNGYPDLVKAAEPLAGVALPTQTPPPSLEAFVAQYGGVLPKARAALELPCKVPLRYEPSDSQSISVAPIEQLAIVFYWDAALARREGQNRDAIRDYLDMCRLGDAVSRGRLLREVENHVGIGFSGIAGLVALRGSLSAAECREATAGLQQLEAQKEPFEVILARQRIWEEHTSSWWRRLFGPFGLVPRIVGPQVGEVEQWQDHTHRALRQWLLGELALRSYLLEHGQLPETLDALVPQYLAAVPQDPFSGQPLVYRRTSAGHILYSVGLDGKDDGGQPVPSGMVWPTWRGDLLFGVPPTGQTDALQPASDVDTSSPEQPNAQ